MALHFPYNDEFFNSTIFDGTILPIKGTRNIKNNFFSSNLFMSSYENIGLSKSHEYL